MTLFLTVIHVIVCLVLILVILLQAGRGQGLTNPGLGSGNVQSLFGTRAADFLTKATSVSAIFFLFTCIGLDLFEAHKSRSLLEQSRPTVPVDIDAIKKALEKVKSEKLAVPATQNPASQATATATPAATAARDAATTQVAPVIPKASETKT